MSPFSAPYNFVPINKYIYEPPWLRLINHDIPLKDGESGTIEVEIKNKSPLFIRDANDQKFSAHIVTNESKHYFIPATSIKGLVSGVLEIISFGKFDRFNDDYFAYRNFDTRIEGAGARSYINRMNNIKCGWLRRNRQDYRLSPCDGSFEKISHEELRNTSRKFNPADTVDLKQEAIQPLQDRYRRDRGKFIVCTGPMHNKRHEYLFPISRLDAIIVDQSVIGKFLSAHKPTPVFENYYLRKLNANDEIPVFYLSEGNSITDIGVSRMIRLSFKHSVAKGVSQESNVNIDLCKAIFGYTHANQALKGRVHIGSAFLKDGNVIQDVRLLPEVVGVLGQPKASYYPLYLKQSGNSFITYDNDNIELAGRKKYRIRSKDSTVDLPQGNENEKVLTRFEPLPAGQIFAFKLSVHNLLPIEIGAILSALTFHNHKEVFHNIGLAKSYGYGKIRFEVKNMIGFKYDAEHYLREFEKEMSKFTYSKMGKIWSETEQVVKLFSIASEHINDNELKIMSLDDYAKYKSKSNPLPSLNESTINIKSLITKDEIICEALKDKLKEKLNEAENYERGDDYIKACELYNEVNSHMERENIQCNDIKAKIKDLESKLAEKKQKEAARRQTKEDERITQIIQSGPNVLSAKDFKGITDRINDWLKKTKNDKIPSEFHDKIHKQIISAFSKFKNPDREKVKDFKETNRYWKKIIDWMGQEKSLKLYDDLFKKDNQS